MANCKFCDNPGLEWGKHQERWRLFERNGELHECLDHSKKKIENSSVPDSRDPIVEVTAFLFEGKLYFTRKAALEAMNSKPSQKVMEYDYDDDIPF